jgi:UDP-GlcNAc:undecaprenyl-phosphate GlcNAc-1-phosphate transferase
VNLYWIVGTVTASFALSFFLTWLTIPIGNRLSFMDDLSSRKVHQSSTSRLGGIGYILPFLLFIFLCKLNVIPYDISFLSERKFVLVAISLFLLIITGLLDDRYTLSAMIKLPVQVVVSILIVYSGLLFDFQIFSNPTVGLVTNVLFTICWILILINSINFIDGLDGLACKVSINILFFLIIFDVFILHESANYFSLMVLIACLLGFLFFNRYPAKTFMGDTGSTFLGAILALYTLEMRLPGRVSSMLTTPFILFLFPFFDVLAAIVRRSYRAQQNGEMKSVRHLITAIFTGDKEHIHHKLLEISGDQRKAVRILVFINFLTGVVSILFFFSKRVFKYLILVLLLLVMFYFLLKMHYLPGISIRKPFLRFLGRNKRSGV